MQKGGSLDQRVQTFLSGRFVSSPRTLAYYTDLWDGHLAAGLGDDHFVSEITSGSEAKLFQRIWEMLCGRHLRACGYDLMSRPEGEPDFRFEHNGLVVWVEAVSPEPGPNLPLEWVKHDPNIAVACGTVPHNEILLRWTTAFDAKWKKGVSYRSKGVIKSTDIYVIAIDGSQLSKFSLAHGLSQMPYIVEATLAVGPIAFEFEKLTGRLLGAVPTVRLFTKNRNMAPVRTEPFLNQAYSAVSAVIGCSAPMFCDPILPIQVAYNPLADVPLALGCFGRSAEEWIAELVSTDAEGQDWELRRLGPVA